MNDLNHVATRVEEACQWVHWMLHQIAAEHPGLTPKQQGDLTKLRLPALVDKAARRYQLKHNTINRIFHGNK